MQNKTINQKQGPRTGNRGNPAKHAEFVSEKADRISYMGRIADQISNAFGRRGEGMKSNRPSTDDVKGLKSISPDTRVRRGPTRGNQ
jgi:hypothetical protein